MDCVHGTGGFVLGGLHCMAFHGAINTLDIVSYGVDLLSMNWTIIMAPC